MQFIFLGALGFILLFIYDINQLYIKNKLLSYLFFVGFTLISFATIGVLFYKSSFLLPLFLRAFLLILAVIFLSLMIYSLFFSIPFKKTYCEQNKFSLYTKGFYALCRHPAVLCFILFYLFLWLSTGVFPVFVAFIVFSIFNILYSLFQDIFIFPKTFDGYRAYKKSTPFIMPNIKTIKIFIADLYLNQWNFVFKAKFISDIEKVAIKWNF